jgi:hypothetical protein
MDNEPILAVIFFQTESGREPVREWLKDLDAGERKVIGEEIKLVQFRSRRDLWQRGWKENE